MEDYESIFPELTESDDERISKHLLYHFRNKTKEEWNGMPVKDIIAYLEEQAEHKKFRDSIQVGDKVTKNEDGVLVNLSQLNRVAKKDEKQSEEIIPLEEIIRNVWELGNYWKELTKGVCNTEHGSQLDYIVKHWKEGEHYIKSFENQGEQKPADKVEPKFKIGDWVVRNGKTLQISCIDTVLDGTFHYWFTKGTWLSSKKMENAMLWTIQDAKDGDVLYENETNTILIFKSQTCGWIKVYCDFWINKNKFTGTDPADYGIVSEMDLEPATKEQRDLLFQKMHEAGYTFDFEKKELKKIEQPKQEWSEEDEAGLNDALWAIKQARTIAKDENDMGNLWYAEDWLKSLKDRVQPQHERNKEDEKCIRLSTDIIDSALRAGFCVQLDRDRCVDWLKSLRPQKQWKPSEEHLDNLNNAANGGIYKVSLLRELYERLKEIGG